MTARKPKHLKVIAGTDRPDRDAVETSHLPGIDEVPAPPDWLPNAHAGREWQRLAPLLVANKILNAGNIGLFGQLCAVYGRLVLLWSANQEPTAALITSYRQMAGELGLFGVALTQPKAGNKFAEHGKRPKGSR